MFCKKSVVTLSRAITLLLLLAGSAFSSATYTVTALTQLPSSAGVDNLNNNNQIAGSYYNGTTYVAFEGSALTFTPEGIPSGLTDVEDAVINDNGVLAGYGTYAPSEDESFIGSAAVPLSGYTQNVGTAFNDSGQLAGDAYGPSGYYASIMTASGTAASGTAYTYFDGINASGTAVGRNGSFQGIYGTTAGVTVMPTLAGYNEMEPGGINAAGHICGYASYSGDYTQAFYFNGTTTAAIPYPTGYSSSAYAFSGCMNDLNQIVGMAVGGSGDAGFIWSPSTGTQILNSLVPATWTITEALYINNSGTILAYGTNGTYTGNVLLTPTPEPSTLWLNGLCLLLPIVVRSRRNRRSHVR